jgi:hypothetical protein
MALIEVINYTRILLLIDHLNAEFGVLYGTTFWMFT